MNSQKNDEYYRVRIILDIHMFDYTIFVFSTFIYRLPAYSIYWTGCDRVVDILSLIDITLLHTRESIIIEFEYISRYSCTRTTAYACTIDVRFAESIFEILESRFIHFGENTY